MFVEALLAYAPFKPLDQAALHGVAGGDVVPADLAVLLSFQHRIRRQLRAVVRDYHAQVSAQLGEAIQLLRMRMGGKGDHRHEAVLARRCLGRADPLKGVKSADIGH